MADSEQTHHGWETWVWDETVFAGTAAYYRQGRDPYAPGLFDALGERLGLDGRGRLLDVGCGPGTVTLACAHLYERVVGLDADAEMLAEGAIAAAEDGIVNADWLRLRAEDLPGDLGEFRTVTFAQSFHWMDRPRVATASRALLEADGTVVQIDRTEGPSTIAEEEAAPPVPFEAIDELRIRWLGPDRRAGQGFRNTSPGGEDQIFQAAGFSPEEIVVVPDGRVIRRTPDEVVARVLSSSWTAPHLFGPRLPEFERELRSLLTENAPEGRFSILLPDNRLRIRRPR